MLKIRMTGELKCGKWPWTKGIIFIQDKVFGDGFSRDIYQLKASIYEKAYSLTSVARKEEGANQESYMFWMDGIADQYPLSTLLDM